MEMTSYEVAQRLCVNDQRNPDCLPMANSPVEFQEVCACDNCYSGLSRLANYTLILEAALVDTDKTLLSLTEEKS